MFIFLWSGKALSHSGWFINYNYQYQEMASSIVAVLLAYFSYVIAPDSQYLIYKLSGLLAATGALAVCIVARTMFFPRHSLLAALTVVFATALSPPYFYWSTGGMEQPYYALLLVVYTCLFASLSQSYNALKMVLFLLTILLLMLVRPEIIWLLIAHLFLVVLLPVKKPCAWAIISLLWGMAALAALMAIRWYGFGYLFPNPVYAKASLFTAPLTTLGNGFDYLASYYFYSPMGWACFVTVLYSFYVWGRHMHQRLRKLTISSPASLLILAAMLLFYLASIVMMGGDWMMFHRFMMPTIPLHMMLLVYMACQRMERYGNSMAAYIVAVPLAISIITQPWFPGNELHAGNIQAHGDTACPLPTSTEGLSLTSLNEAWMKQNYTVNRDAGMVQFVRDELPKWVDKAPLVILTYQAGLFPMTVRDSYPQMQDSITFIDSSGLINLDIAKVPVAKSAYGNNAGHNPLSILEGKEGELSTKILAYQPTMVYLLHPLSDNDKKAFKTLGYTLMWNQPYAVFLSHDGIQKIP